MESKAKNALTEVGSNIAGSLASSALAETALPGFSVLGAVIGPIVTEVSNDIAQRVLSHLENKRINAVRDQIVVKIQSRINAGEQWRRDEEFYLKDEYEQSSASKLLEETMLKTKHEFEAKKLKYYSNFWANICFENEVTYETANSLIGLFSEMSYQQVKILVFLNTETSIPLGKWEKYMYSDSTLFPYFTVYSDCLHLYNRRLAAQHVTNPGSIQLGTPEICISPSGRLLCKLFELKMSDIESSEIKSLIHSINGIVNRLMTEANDDGSDRQISPISEKDIDRMLEEKKGEIIEAAQPKLSVIDEQLNVGKN